MQKARPVAGVHCSERLGGRIVNSTANLQFEELPAPSGVLPFSQLMPSALDYVGKIDSRVSARGDPIKGLMDL